MSESTGPTKEQILATAQRTNPSLVKFLHRVFAEGISGVNAVTEAMKRLAESKRSEANGAMTRTSYQARDEEILQLRRPEAPGLWAADGFTSRGSGFLGTPAAASIIPLSSPLAGLINHVPAIMKNPKYHDYYLANFGHDLPIPYAATDGMANKTLGVRASVSDALTVAAGCKAVIVPSPDHWRNRPYLMYVYSGTVWSSNEGDWYGGYSPQSLLGPPPTPSVRRCVDDRSLQFKGGLLEATVSVAYNQSCVVGFIDPFSTMGYGMALGLMQSHERTLDPTTRVYSSQPREYPYSTEIASPTWEGLMSLAVRSTLIGSSASSGIALRQIIRPFGHCFACATDVGATTDDIESLGYNPILNVTDPANASSFAQGMYLIDNTYGSSAVAVELKMEMAYRARVDNQAPAVYMMADSETVPKHSIEFRPVTTAAPTIALAAEKQAAAHGSKAVAPSPVASPADTAHMQKAVAAMRRSEPSLIGKISNVVSNVPVVGSGLSTAIRGGEKIAHAGDAGDVFAGLLDVGKGLGSAVSGFFGL